MPKVQVKTKTGAIITIEGTEEEISRMTNNFLGMGMDSRRNGGVSEKKTQPELGEKRRTPAELVLELREGGYFKTPKGLGEIATTLEERGYLYPVTTLSGLMLDLVKKKMLGRKKISGKWKYGN